MKKTLLVLVSVLSFLAVTTYLHAQVCSPLAPAWPQTGGNGSCHTEGSAVATDGLGNVYVAGTFREEYPSSAIPSISFGGATFTGLDSCDHFYVVKYDRCGSVQWAAVGNILRTDLHGNATVNMDIDPFGTYVYVTSRFFGNLKIKDGTGALITTGITGSGNSFISKLDAFTGAYVKAVGTSYTEYDGDQITVSGNSVFQENYRTVYKYDLSLNLLDSLYLTPLVTGGLVMDAIDSDISGNVFVAGTFYGTLNGAPPAGTTSNPAVNDLFILKISSSMVPVYAQKGGAYGSHADIRPRDIYLDASGIYVTGRYSVVAGSPYQTLVPLPLTTGTGGFVCKFTDAVSTASFNWGAQITYPPVAVAGSSSIVYAVGNYFAESFFSSTGLPASTSMAGGYGKNICYNSIDNAFYVTGFIEYPVTLNKTLVPAGYEDMYTARLNSGSAYYRKSGTTEHAVNDIRPYPNPAADKTFLEFRLESAGEVTISLFDISGKLVQQLPTETLDSGPHRKEIPTASLKSGFYFIKVETTRGDLEGKLIKL